MGFIYKISNDFDSNVYIGQTTTSIEIRWGRHLSDARTKPRTHIAHAIKKYGAEHYAIEQIEECDNSILDEREIYWISFYNSYKNGYNSTIGGSGGTKCNPEEFVELWDYGFNIREISEKTGFCYDTVRKHLQAIDRIKIEVEEHLRNSNKEEISQYTLYGDYVATYSSITEAAKSIGCGCSTISSYLSAGRSTCCGYQWRKGSSKENIGLASGQRKAIVKLSKSGEFLNLYISLSEAAKENNISPSNLSKACRKGYKYGGFSWMYYDNYISEMENCQVAEAS